MPAPVRAVVIGAGLRGRGVYGRYALERPERLRVVALAEPDAQRRTAFASEHGLTAHAVFEDWPALFEAAPPADVAIVATGDALHVGPALAAIARGHHLLLEKPIAPHPLDCLRVVDAAERAGRLLQIGHVLRYTPFYARVQQIVASGALGDLIQIDLREHVAGWHMAHSFVRGKFRKREIAAPFLLAKSCHDLDLLVWLADREARAVSSFGGLSGFRPDVAPPGAPARCTDGCPAQAACVYDAERFYVAPDDGLGALWPWSDLGADASRGARRRALETGPYGRCVYHTDNDVLDHQVVILEFAGGLTASFGVHGHASHEERRLRITGTRGELQGALDRGELVWTRHGSLERETLRFEGSPVGHYGGDHALLDHFLDAVASGDAGALLASGRASLESHWIGFAAERAREQGRVVVLADFCAEQVRALAGEAGGASSG